MRYDLVIFDFHGTLVDGASRLVPDAAEMIRDLAEAGLTLGIVGSTSESAVREVLGPAQHLFDAYRCETTTAAAQKLLSIASRMGASLDTTIYVGAETSDVAAAQKAGVASAAVTYGQDKRAPLAAAGPTMLVESLYELVGRLTNRPFLRLVT